MAGVARDDAAGPGEALGNSKLQTPNSQLPTPNSQAQFLAPMRGRAARTALCWYMEPDDWTIQNKPYDLRERLFLFACLMVRVVRFLHTRGPIAIAFSDQVLRSGTSAGANYEEADDGSSPRDTLAKRKITLRELKETRSSSRDAIHGAAYACAGSGYPGD